MSPNPIAMAPPRTARMAPRVAGISTLLLVFLCGAVVGAFAFNLSMHKRLHKAAFWTDSAKTVYLEKVRKELDLTPEQVEQMRSILDDFAQYYMTVVSDGKSRIMQILNDSQKKQFEQMLEHGSNH